MAGDPVPVPDGPSWCRLAVLTPRRRVDVALPADVPVAELVPMLLELLGEPRPGARPVPWVLSGSAGGPLPAAATLGGLGVLDGELLRLAPPAPVPRPPVFDDPVDVVVDTVIDNAADTVGGAAADHGRGSGRSTAVLLLACGAAVVLGGGGTGGPGEPFGAAGIIAAVGAAAAVGVAVRVRKATPDPTAGSEAGSRGTRTVSPVPPAPTWALAAVPLAAAAGWRVGDAGAPIAGLLLGVVAAGVVAAIGQAVLRRVAPALVATVAVAVVLAPALTVMARTGAGPVPVAAAVALLGLVVSPVLPGLSLRLAGVPRPVVPADGAEPGAADDGGAPQAELAARAARARGLHVGLTGASAGLVAAGSVPVALLGGGPGVGFALLAWALLMLRARGLVDRAAVRLLRGAALGAVVVVSVLVVPVLAAAGTGAVRALIGVVLLGLAVLIATVGSGRFGGGSPVLRRAVDLTEWALLAGSVPLGLWVMGLFGLVRGL